MNTSNECYTFPAFSVHQATSMYPNGSLHAVNVPHLEMAPVSARL